MQIVVDRLDRPWGLAQQARWLGRWLADRGKSPRVVTRRMNEATSAEPIPWIEVSRRPWRRLDPSRPTLAGPYPAVGWAKRADVERYSLLLSHLPWGLYPSRQREWLGRLPVYYRNNRDLFWRSLRYLMTAPFRGVNRRWKRWRDQRAARDARRLFVLDDRLREPVDDLYGRSPESVRPIVPVGHEGVNDPEKYFLVLAPLEPVQNLRRIVDAFYLFVNRLGARHQPDWEEAHPLRMWKPGDVELHIYGEGSGEDYLRDYVRSQQLEDQVTVASWPEPGRLDSMIRSALAVLDIPLAGNASILPYQALASGVPAVYTQWHKELEAAIGDSRLAHRVGGTREDEIARGLLEASRVPTSERTPLQKLREVLSPESSVTRLVEAATSPA